jgi:hypothetical protein
MKPIVWIILIVVVLAVIGPLVMMSRRRQLETRREEAADLRAEAEQHDRDHREREASAAEAQAQAEKARAEAEEQRARAVQLEAEAERRAEHATAARDERDEHLRRADERDPDVDVSDRGVTDGGDATDGDRLDAGDTAVDAGDSNGRSEWSERDDSVGSGARHDGEQVENPAGTDASSVDGVQGADVARPAENDLPAERRDADGVEPEDRQRQL